MTSRHELVWLTRAGWDAALAAAPAQHDDILRDWYERDFPAVVRRHDPDATGDVVCLGIPLPLAQGARARVALQARLEHVARRRDPLTVGDALAGAPSQWLAPLIALQRDCSGLDMRVFGSLAMASITGLPYLRPESDIDLLLRPGSRADLEAGCALLEQHARLLPLDGEIVFPSGDAVAWREWRAAPRARARVLVKSLHGVRLDDPALLAATLAPA